MTARYLSQAAISRRLGGSRHLVGTLRNRYKDSPTPFPGPDAWIGDGEDDDRAVPGWLPGRMPEIRRWKDSLPGQGAGGGRPRKEPASPALCRQSHLFRPGLRVLAFRFGCLFPRVPPVQDVHEGEP